MDDHSSAMGGEKRRTNWWKVAFFALLVIFEFTREIAVVEGSAPAEPNSGSPAARYGSLVTAAGSWKRLNGGSPMSPAVIAIECHQDRGTCIEVATTMSDRWVMTPSIDTFVAKFGEDAVTYENDVPECARYSVRIDLRLKQVFAVRDRKDQPTMPSCANLERRIEMQLVKSSELTRDEWKGHFVPLLRVLRAVFGGKEAPPEGGAD